MSKQFRYHLAVYVALFATILGICASTSQAKPPGYIDSADVTATTDAGTWESKPVQGLVALNVEVNGHEVPMMGYQKCTATFTDGKTFVWATALGCNAPGTHAMRFRYLSVGGTKRVHLLLYREPRLLH